MTRLLPLAFVCLTLGGCASMTAEQCRSASWYDLGFRDGLFGMQSQVDIYGSQCREQGAAADQARYGEGWQHGFWELQGRRSASGAD